MQNKTMRSHLILVRMIIIPVRWLLSKETQVTNVRGDMEKRGGRVTKHSAGLSPRPFFPPVPLCAAKHISPPSLCGGRPKALHYTTGLHPEKRRVSCKIHFEATFEKAHLYLPMCST